MSDGIKLADIARVLGCSVQAASYLRRGKYGEIANESELPARYERLMALIAAARDEVAVERICVSCPREDCMGCRIAEMV